MIGLIAKREWQSLFVSPFGWCLIAALQAMLGTIFFYQLRYFLEPPPEAVLLPELWGVTRIAVMPMLNWGAFLFVLVIPLLTMRQLSDERRMRTLTLLLSAPISATQIVLGKFLATLGVIGLVVVLALLPIIVFSPSVALDYGLIASGLLAITLLGMTLAAVGLFISSLTDNSALAGAVTVAIGVGSWLIGAQTPTDLAAPVSAALHYLSWQHHLEFGLRGILTTDSLIFHLSISALCIYLTLTRVHSAGR